MDLLNQDVNRIGRFRIDALIGRGGMGHVYKAFDEMLERTVALKALSPERRFSALDMTRFLREARILSQLDHPNICRIYDYFEWRDHDFLVLEFIEGRTLTDELALGLSLALKIEIAETLAAVLGVAHRSDIIHRDLKPDNVMIDGRGDIRVLDFGLGRKAGSVDELDALEQRLADESGDLDDERSSSSKTTVGSIVGTLRYMSPEGAQGEDVSLASDIYSFGVLLYEMFNGRSPYPSDLPHPALLLRVMQADIDPSDAALPSDIQHLIQECLALTPSDRPAATQLARTLAEIRSKPARRKRALRAGRWFTGIAALLIAAVLLTWRIAKPKPILSSSNDMRMALLPIIDLSQASPDHQWFPLGLRDLAALQLAEIRGISMVPTEQLAAMDLQHDRLLDPDQLENVRQALQADLVGTAWIENAAPGYRIHYQISSDRGKIVGGYVEALDPANAANRLGQALFKRLTGQQKLQNVLSQNSFVNQIYAIGVHRLNTLGPAQAHEFFRVCLQIDEGFHWARFQLAVAMLKMGDWDDARRVINELLSLIADEDPRLTAHCYQTLGSLDFRQGLRDPAAVHLNNAMTGFTALGDHSGIGNTHRQIGVIEFYDGDLEAAETRWQQALSAYHRARDALGQAKVLNNLGALNSNRGEMETSDACHHQALEIRRKLGDREGMADTFNNLGSNAWHQSDIDRAEMYFRKALDLYRVQGNEQREAQVLSNLAECVKAGGAYRSATGYTQKAIALYKKSNNLQQLGIATNNLGDTYRLMGRYRQAEEQSWQSLLIHLSLGDEQGAIWCLHALALVSYEQRFWDQAIAIGEYALSELDRFENLDKRASLLNDLGEFHLQAGFYNRSAEYLKRAETDFSRLGSRQHVAMVQYNMANLAIKLGDLNQARQHRDQARQWLGDEPIIWRLASRLLAEEGRLVEAIEQLECARNQLGDAWTWEWESEYRKLLERAKVSAEP